MYTVTPFSSIDPFGEAAKIQDQLEPNAPVHAEPAHLSSALQLNVYICTFRPYSYYRLLLMYLFLSVPSQLPEMLFPNSDNRAEGHGLQTSALLPQTRTDLATGEIISLLDLLRHLRHSERSMVLITRMSYSVEMSITYLLNLIALYLGKRQLHLCSKASTTPSQEFLPDTPR